MRIAVIGSGISGVGATWLLSGAHTVDLYEAADVLGGHTHTVDVSAGGLTFPVDSGFMVFNRRTYPNLIRFFERLGITAHDADMSFSVEVADENIQWSGTNLNTVFAQRKNITNPKFLRMLADVLRFSRDANRLLADPTVAELTLGQLVAREGYSESFSDWYLIPMGDAIWSTPPGDMFDYPAHTFLRFCDNHGLLHVLGKPQWLSVDGGARRYLDAASKTFSGEVFTGEPAERIERTASGVRVNTPQRSVDYDVAILATHPPQTREILGQTMSAEERALLEAFDYWPNDVIIHTDQSFLPPNRRAWASWNWFTETSDLNKSMLMLTYQINTLQHLPADAPVVMETLNRKHEPAEGAVLEHITFDHPMYTAAAIAAQNALPRIQGLDRLFFAGAWTRYGFHEDGLLSAVRVAERLGAPIPWADELDASHTLVLADAPTPMLGQVRQLAPGEVSSAISSDPSAAVPRA